MKQADVPVAVAEPRFLPGMTTEDKLNTLLWNKFEQLLKTHSVSFDLASEGRGRGKKPFYIIFGNFWNS